MTTTDKRFKELAQQASELLTMVGIDDSAVSTHYDKLTDQALTRADEIMSACVNAMIPFDLITLMALKSMGDAAERTIYEDVAERMKAPDAIDKIREAATRADVPLKEIPRA